MSWLSLKPAPAVAAVLLNFVARCVRLDHEDIYTK